MDALDLAQDLERWGSLGIALVAGALAALSVVAWRRERAPRMLVVASGYALFAVFGALTFLERAIARVAGFGTAEVLEHGGTLLVLAGLVVFFFAIARE